MYRRTLRQQAMYELILEVMELSKQGQRPSPDWRHEIIVKSRMKEIRKRRKAEKPGPPPGMLPLDFTGNPEETNTDKSDAGMSGARKPTRCRREKPRARKIRSR
jgi:hypothetical protein